MADNNTATTDTSIYRQQPQQNPLQMLTQVGQAADSLGGIAAGQAVQGAMGDDGQIDRNKLANLLRQSVAGSMKAIPTLNALEQLKSAGFAADQAGLETFQKRMAITHHLFSGLASKDNPTMNDVYDVATRALDPALDAKKYGITLPVIMNALKSFRDPATGKPLNAAQIKQKALEIQTQAAATSEILHQHSPQMEAVDRGGNIEYVPRGTAANPAAGTVVPKNLGPTVPVATPGGTQYMGEQPAPAPAATRFPPTSTGPNRPAGFGQRFEGTTPPGGGLPAVFPRMRPPEEAPSAVPEPAGSPSAPRPVGTQTITPPTPAGPAQSLRPGYTEAAASVAQSGAAQANSLTQANDSSMTRKAMLGNLEEDLTKFTAGGGADWTRIAKNWTNRNLPVPKAWQEPGGMLDPQSVAGQEQFNKQAAMLAQQQFGAIGGTGTDAKFNSAFTTSPNETLSQLGNHGIIRLLKGNEDAIQAKNSAWNKWRKANGPDTYADFSEDFNNRFDPRAFQFRYMKPEERSAYVKGMEPEERNRFLHDLTYARKQGWVKFDVK